MADLIDIRVRDRLVADSNYAILNYDVVWDGPACGRVELYSLQGHDQTVMFEYDGGGAVLLSRTPAEIHSFITTRLAEVSFLQEATLVDLREKFVRRLGELQLLLDIVTREVTIQFKQN